MKKFLFGMMITVLGLIFAALCFLWAAVQPWNYTGIDGLLGSFLGTGTLLPFGISLVLLFTGVMICWFEAYHKK